MFVNDMDETLIRLGSELTFLRQLVKTQEEELRLRSKELAEALVSNEQLGKVIRTLEARAAGSGEGTTESSDGNSHRADAERSKSSREDVD